MRSGLVQPGANQKMFGALKEKVRLWFSPEARFVAQQQALGKTAEQIDIELRLLKARQWLTNRKTELFERENPRPILRTTSWLPVLDDDDPHSSHTDWSGYIQEMNAWEAARDEALAEPLDSETSEEDGQANG